MCKKFLISGRVQGVFFRASAQTQATALGISGYAKNLPDGRVEILACGHIAKIQQLLDWLWQGPPQARVTHIEEQTCTEHQESGFAII